MNGDTRQADCALRSLVEVALGRVFPNNANVVGATVGVLESQDVFFVWQLPYLSHEDWTNLQLSLGLRIALQNEVAMMQCWRAKQ